jgi:hypothetical protein
MHFPTQDGLLHLREDPIPKTRYLYQPESTWACACITGSGQHHSCSMRGHIPLGLTVTTYPCIPFPGSGGDFTVHKDARQRHSSYTQSWTHARRVHSLGRGLFCRQTLLLAGFPSLRASRNEKIVSYLRVSTHSAPKADCWSSSPSSILMSSSCEATSTNVELDFRKIQNNCFPARRPKV